MIPLPRQLALCHEATQRLIRTVDGLPDESYADPSALPGWSRAHVVAHLALNAEAMERALAGAVSGTDAAMYDSDQGRDAAITELAAATPLELRQRLMASTATLRDTMSAVPVGVWTQATFPRLPSGPRWPVADAATLRWQEVEIHHTDLVAGYAAEDWPEEFLDHIFNAVVRDRQHEVPVLLRTPDGDVPFDDPSTVVTGSRLDLTRWLLGRSAGEGLRADPELPRLGPWE